MEVTAIGESPRGDDAALGHQLRARRCSPQLLPQLVDLAVAPEGAVAVGEHRVLVRRTSERAERFELDDGQLPVTEAVQREAVELAHGRRARRLVRQRLEDLASVGIALPLERLRRLCEA